MTREQAISYISYCVDDALAERRIDEMPDNARLIGWQCASDRLAMRLRAAIRRGLV
jgi:hypothetical protein